MIATDDLERRLRDLGESLVFDDAELADAVSARLASEPTSRRRIWPAAAAVVLLVVLGIALLPDARHAVARWFGLDSVKVVVDPSLDTEPVGTAPPVVIDLPGPGESRAVDVDGHAVLISTLDGALNPGLITKSVQASAQVTEVDVGGAPGLWIEGSPHEILYESPDGEIVFERMAADTLLWQRGDVLTRIEGFEQLDQALDFARRHGLDATPTVTTIGT